MGHQGEDSHEGSILSIILILGRIGVVLYERRDLCSGQKGAASVPLAAPRTGAGGGIAAIFDVCWRVNVLKDTTSQGRQYRPFSAWFSKSPALHPIFLRQWIVSEGPTLTLYIFRF
jgi:hypothetical protein